MARVIVDLFVPEAVDAAAVYAAALAAAEAAGAMVFVPDAAPDYGACSGCPDGRITSQASESYTLDGQPGTLNRSYCDHGCRVETFLPDAGEGA